MEGRACGLRGLRMEQTKFRAWHQQYHLVDAISSDWDKSQTNWRYFADGPRPFIVMDADAQSSRLLAGDESAYYAYERTLDLARILEANRLASDIPTHETLAVDDFVYTLI